MDGNSGRRFIDATALIITNSLIGFLLLNLILSLFSGSLEHPQRASAPLAPPKALKAHQGIQESFHQLHFQGFEFRPYYHHGEKAFSSSAIQIHPLPGGFTYRTNRTNGPPRKPDKNSLLVFGSSQVFGMWVPNASTLPAQLERHMGTLQQSPIEVFNFGVRGHNWMQTLLHFQRILHAGYRPKTVLFLDGIPNNLTQPYFFKKTVSLWEFQQLGLPLYKLPDIVPVFGWMNRILDQSYAEKLNKQISERYKTSTSLSPPLSRLDYYKSILNQRQVLAKHFKIQAFTAWLPNAENRKILKENPPNFFNLASLMKSNGFQESYLDGFHFSARMHDNTAQFLARKILKHSTTPERGTPNL